MKYTVVVYGFGGHDETKPNNNIIETYEVDDGLPEETNINN